MKQWGALIGLIVLGGAVLSTDFPDAVSNYKWLGWIPLLIGVGIIVGKITGKL